MRFNKQRNTPGPSIQDPLQSQKNEKVVCRELDVKGILGVKDIFTTCHQPWKWVWNDKTPIAVCYGMGQEIDRRIREEIPPSGVSAI